MARSAAAETLYLLNTRCNGRTVRKAPKTIAQAMVRGIAGGAPLAEPGWGTRGRWPQNEWPVIATGWGIVYGEPGASSASVAVTVNTWRVLSALLMA